MEIEIGIGKSGRRAYGFDDIAIVPSRRTRDPEDVDISWEVDAYKFELPLIAAAMDGVSSPATAIEVGELGGLACLNLEGLWTRYDDLDPVFEEIASLPPEKATRRMQELYAEPIKDELIGKRITEIKEGGVRRLRLAHPPAGRALLKARARGRPRRPRHPGHGRVGRARVEERRAAQPQEVHPRVRRAGHRRAGAPRTPPRCTSCAPARSASSSASGPGTRAPAGRCSASGSRRRPPSPTPPALASVTSTRPASTCTSSPTAGCAPAATSPRRSPAAPTR